MIVGAAVCPGAPFLVPGLAPGLMSTLPELVHSCRRAVARLAGTDRVLLLTSRSDNAPEGGLMVHGPGTPVASTPLTGRSAAASFAGQLAGGDPIAVGAEVSGFPTPAPGIGVLVGAALLSAADVRSASTAVETSSTATAADQWTWARDSPVRIGVLLIADGSANRGPESPGGGNAGAAAFDASLSAALAAGDPAVIARAVDIPAATAQELLFTSGPAFAAFAGLTADRPPARTEVLYDDAPLGVGYVVATWAWPDPGCSSGAAPWV